MKIVLSLLAIFLTVVSSQRVIFAGNPNANPNLFVLNMYVPKLVIHSIANLPTSNVEIRFLNAANDAFLAPDNVALGAALFNATFDHTVATFAHAYNAHHISPNVGIVVRNIETDKDIATFNLSQNFVDLFPDTAQFDPFYLWPKRAFDQVAQSGNIELHYTAEFKGVVSYFGKDSSFEVWKFLVVLIAGMVFLSLVLSVVDLMCMPSLRLIATSTRVGFVVGNFFWLIFGGLLAGFVYILVGVLLVITVVMFPLGIKLIRFGTFALLPFGKDIKKDQYKMGVWSWIGNMIWFVLIGIPLIFVHVTLGLALCCGIVTIPLGLMHFKLLKFAVMPFGHSTVYQSELQRGGDSFERTPLMVPPPGRTARTYQ